MENHIEKADAVKSDADVELEIEKVMEVVSAMKQELVQEKEKNEEKDQIQAHEDFMQVIILKIT